MIFLHCCTVAIQEIHQHAKNDKKVMPLFNPSNGTEEDEVEEEAQQNSQEQKQQIKEWS